MGDVVATTGAALAELTQGYMAVMAIIDRLSRRYDRLLLEQLIYQPYMNANQLCDVARMNEWAAQLIDRLNVRKSESSVYEAAIEAREDGEGYGVFITRRAHSVVRQARLTAEFFASPEYVALAEFGARVAGLFAGEAQVRRGERIQSVGDFRATMDWLLEEARRGQHIQRYKGLGEMNPDQLWDTTMNPESRRLLQVRIEDAVAADEVFTTLMGDQVEPRRDFIEQNALDVLNLDV